MLHEALQPLLAPVVIISACGLLIMALNARTMAAQARIRQLHHERLEISEIAAATGIATQTQRLRYEGVGSQSNKLLCRLYLMRMALMMMVGCVVLMLVSSIFIGLESVLDIPLIARFVIGVFVLGILSMLSGAVIFLMELRLSLKEVGYEHERMMGLALPPVQEAE